ncbi:kinase-like domain-containing protein [Mrakia frigida]|uniref:serine/threonine protein kinase CDC7 n=1 Tax=Mrakia frigida TaxID=29902 RepID=UPI003FCBF3EB
MEAEYVVEDEEEEEEDGATPRQRRVEQNGDEEMYEEQQEEEEEEEEEIEEVNFVDEMPGRTDEERAQLNEEMGDLEETVKGLAEDYLLVDRLGEGTFSSVYKAIDLKNSDYNNSLWLNPSSESDDEGAGPSTRRKVQPKVYVAIKRIYVTSSPSRIENEISILEDLRGCTNISQVITAFRYEDQILVVMPFHCNDDFRNYYRHLSITSLRSYFRELFRALRATHARGILHRDVKPANFLFDESDGSGILVDFGLAQYPHGKREQTRVTRTVEQAVYEARKRSKLPADRVGFPHDDKRPSVKANRAGTRGFRAPEVLLKCPDQSVAIDIWSAGIILLSILTRKFPIFNSNDDTEALMEISAIFGKTKMDKCASIHNRTLISNVPALDHAGHNLESIILTANPYLYSNHSPDDTLQEHEQGIAEALDLLKHILALDPCKRYTAGQALEHEFLAEEGVDPDFDGPRGPGMAVCAEGHKLNDDGSPCPIHSVRDWRKPGTYE